MFVCTYLPELSTYLGSLRTLTAGTQTDQRYLGTYVYLYLVKDSKREEEKVSISHVQILQTSCLSRTILPSRLNPYRFQLSESRLTYNNRRETRKIVAL